MLQAIREKVTGWIAYGIIFLISIPFALWGVNSYFGTGEVLPAATVNGEEITVRELDQQYNQYRRRLAQLFGGTIPDSLRDDATMRATVLDQLIEERALRQYIEERRYRIADASLGQRIREMEEFQSNGSFDQEIYQRQLRSIGMSPLDFEYRMGLSGSIEQFQAGIQGTALVTPKSRDLFLNLRNQTRKLRTLSYRVDPAAVEVNESDVEQYYLAHSSDYNAPEQIRLDYIEVSLEAVKQNIDVEEDEIESRYDENREAYTSAEFRDTSHILIRVNEDADDDTAMARISEIRTRIVGGESFADLARELSEDPLSAAEGGSLGEVGRGDMVPTFEAALYALEPGQLSEPVKTGFGWHLILVNSVTGGDVEAYESVRATLEDEIKSEKAELQIYELIQRMSDLAYEQDDTLDPLSDEFDFTLQRSDWFDRSSGSGLAADSRIRGLAFSEDLLERGRNSEAIELGDDRVVFMRVGERRPERSLPLDEVSDRVRAALVAERLSEISVGEGTRALQSLRSGESLDNLASEWAATVVDLGFVGRNQADANPAVLQRGFSMPKPEGGISYDGLSQGDGEYVIIELSAVISSDAAAADEDSGTLLRAQGGSDYQAVLKYLGASAEVFRTPIEEIDLDSY